MTRKLLRLWIVVTLLWWGYNLFLHRDKISSFATRDWRLGLEYGLNSIVCDVGLSSLCRDIPVSFWKKSYVNETFALIVTFAGWPFAGLLLCLMLGWALRPAPRVR